MTEPTNEEFEIYERVKDYLKDEAALRAYGYLSPTDSVFAPGGATVTIGGPRDFYHDPGVKYEEGYYQAATELIEWSIDGFQKDWLVYPILFIFLHALELSLKKLIFDWVVPVPERLGKTHNLKELWEVFLLPKLNSYAVPQNAALISKIIRELEKIGSMNLRFAWDKKYEDVSIPEPQEISLQNVQALIGKLYNELYNIQVTLESQQFSK